MDKEWMPNGVVGLKPYKLKKESKMQLQAYLKKEAFKSDKISPFILALETAVSEYHAMLEITTKCKPSEIRGNLGSALNQIKKLREKLNALDSNSRIIVNNISKDGMPGVFDGLFDLNVTINDALKVAEQYPKKGQLVTYYKRNLVDSIADAIKSILNVKPVSTKEGLLEQCTAIVLIDITGKPADGIHTLIEKVIKSRKNR